MLVGCYKIYQGLAVPLLEGSAAPPDLVEPEYVSHEAPNTQSRDLVAQLFPEGSWERNCATVLKNDQFLLVVQDWEQLDEHRLRITPCTIVYFPDGPPDATTTAADPPSGRTWMIQAAEGAILHTDQPSDIRRGQLSKVSAVYIPGQVRLTGSESFPQAGDAIELITNHLQINRQKIWTPHEVHVRWGDNLMQGSDLTLHLTDSNSADQPLGLPFGKTNLRSMEMVHLNALKVQTPTDTVARNGALEDEWLEVGCEGPLIVDLLGGVARISRNVQIARIGKTNQTDRLNCEELTARFTQWTTEANRVARIQLDRLVATGEPAIVSSHQQVVSEVGITSFRDYEFRCAKWEYDGASGEFTAMGAGQFEATMTDSNADSADDPSGKKSVVSWQRQLRWEQGDIQQSMPDMQLVVDGEARCESENGTVEADRIRLWFEPRPADVTDGLPTRSVKTTGYPRRILAEGKVEVRSDGFHGGAERLDIVVSSLANSTGLPNLPATSMQLRAPANTPRVQDAETRNRYQVYGQSMRVAVQKDRSQWNVKDVTLDGHVRCMAFSEDSTGGEAGSEPPRSLDLEGRTLLLRELGDGQGVVTIAGTPARVRARGMTLDGPAIRLDRRQNRISIDGSGSASLPLPAQVALRYPRDAAFAYVTWTGGLNFDGSSIICNQNVQVRGPAQRMSADQLSVNLSRTLNFSQQEIESSAIQLDSIVAEGSVRIENKSLSPRGLESIDVAHVNRLAYDYASGDVVGDGPGFVETVRLRKNQGGRGPLGSGPLIYLRVEFQRQFAANLTRRQADFTNRVFATFGPVSDWNQRVDAPNATQLQNGQLVMSCEQLSIFQVRAGNGAATNQNDAVELTAEGNTTIEGQQFKAEAHRLSYDQSKDLLVMEGSGRSDVHLVRQSAPGGPKQETSAAKVRYSPSANTVQVNGMKMLNLGSLPNGQR